MGSKKSKNKRKKSKKGLAKQKPTVEKVQINTEQPPKSRSALIQKILQYKKWIPFGLIAFCIPFYVSYYPDDVEISTEILGKQTVFSNALIIHNPNSYDVKNINIRVVGVTSQSFDSGGTVGNYFEGVGFEFFKHINKINAKQSSHVVNDVLNHGEPIYIVEFTFDVLYSFETPFIYPNINEVRTFSGYINSEGETIYLQN